MPTIIQDLYEEITNELRNLKTDKNKDQVNINKLIRMNHCLSYDFFIKSTNMDFLNKVAVIKEYRQSVLNSENIVFLVL